LQNNLWTVDVDPFARNTGIRRAKRTRVPGVSSKCVNHARGIAREKNLGTRCVVLIGPAPDEIARVQNLPPARHQPWRKEFLARLRKEVLEWSDRCCSTNKIVKWTTTFV
jgi:hypothetical protein